MYIRTYVVVIQRASTLYLARSGRHSDSALIIQEGEPVVRVPAIPTRQHRRRNPPGQSRTPYAESHDKRPYVYAPYSTQHCSVIDSPTLSFLLFDYNNRPPVRLCTLSAAYFKRFPSIWRLAYMYIICTTLCIQHIHVSCQVQNGTYRECKRWVPLRSHPGTIVYLTQPVTVQRSTTKRNNKNKYQRLTRKTEIMLC